MFHISLVYFLLYVPYMLNSKKKNMYSCEAAAPAKLRWNDGPFAPTNEWTTFGNYIYTTIVSNDTALS